MRADLHTHSRYSDGGSWPADIAALAAGVGLQAVCVSDHDTLGGYPEFAAAAGALGLRTWPAVEIDCVDPEISYKSEILAYFPGGTYSATERFLAAGRADRQERMGALFQKAALVFSCPALDFNAVTARRVSGRPAGAPAPDASAFRYSKTDLYVALRDAGLIPESSDYREFKKAYFETGIFSDVRFAKPELGFLSGLVARDGGILVVPHIGHEFGDSARAMKLGLERLDRMLDRFRELGVAGVELYDYRNPGSEAINALVRERAEKRGFFYTYGSDSHGPGSRKDGLGSFYGDFDGFDGLSTLKGSAGSGARRGKGRKAARRDD